jgi:RNA polymerase sigma-70 factor (ECF subfamily)
MLDEIRSAEDPETDILRTQEAALVERCLDALSREQRGVLLLADVEELTASRIAELVGSNPNAVYTRLRAARARLLGRLAQAAPEP